MGYVRDESTGKFTWIDGEIADDDPLERRPVRVAAAAAARPATSVPVWVAQLGVGAVACVVLGVVAWWSMQNVRRDPMVSIRRIHARPADYEGRVVRVRGAVGQVFPVGDSYAYYLLQGRDTIVVYTHGARPKPSDGAEVTGSITVGYLDGAVRTALFERN